MSKTNINISLKDDVSRKEYNRQYYLLKKNNKHTPKTRNTKINADKSKTYYELNKEKILSKTRNDEYKNKKTEYNKSYYLKNKELIDKRSAVRNDTKHHLITINIWCIDCQTSVKKYCISKHIKTETHKFNVENPTHKYSKKVCYECHSFYENKTTHIKSKKHIQSQIQIQKEETDLLNSEL